MTFPTFPQSLSLLSIRTAGGLWDLSKWSGPSPDGYCGLPDATASSSSSHSWAPKKTASRNGELMGIYWDLTQVIGSLTIAMPKSPL